MRVIYCVGNGSGGPAAVAGEEPSLSFVPYLVRVREDGVVRGLTLGHPALDEYLAFVGSRARLNTWLAVAWDLKIFFEVVGKEPAAVRPACRHARSRVGCRASGACSPICWFERTPAWSTTPSRPAWLLVAPARDAGGGGVPLIRTPRALPRVLSPAAVDGLRAALRTHRDRAMVDAMVLGGLRRCEVLGL